MAYKIAVVSADGENIDRSFGAAEQFLIYEVTGPGIYELSETRLWLGDKDDAQQPTDCGSGCGRGTGGGFGSCGGTEKIGAISDCRSLLCDKIGFQAEKQLSRQAITVFDIACPIGEALDRITVYFDRVDQHQNLRGIARKSS